MTRPDDALVERVARDFLWLGCQVGHDWRSIGGANCGCEGGNCSVPVHECARCGDCDYGQNDEADQKRSECAALAAAEKEGR